MTAHGSVEHGWTARLRGRFLVFEGPDGSGKTTQLHKLTRVLRDAGLTVCEVREPGGTPIGERVRDILLDPIHDEMDVRCEMMLYMASRAQLVAQRIIPALERGEVVLADRFVQSTLAYQGTAGGLPGDEILAVARAACGRAWPDLVLVYDVDEQTAASRLNPLLDRMEQKGAAFHRKVRGGYLQQAKDDPDRYLVIDATRAEAEVHAATLELLAARTERL